MNTITLSGCSPTPLAFYLKALGVFRIVAEQFDPKVKAAWRNDSFVLETEFGRDDLLDFFANRYKPTPIVAPWNGGSGYYPKDKGAKKALDRISSGDAVRFAALRNAISVCRKAVEGFDLKEKPEGDVKSTLMEFLRASLPDRAVEWLDASFVLTTDTIRFPPLLGKGGIDARLEFSKGFAEQLGELFDCDNGTPRECCKELLGNSIFGQSTDQFVKKTIGQFFPSQAAGYNSASGFEGEPRLNPWDVIFLIEGSLILGAAAVRRLQTGLTGGYAAAPFTVKASAAGFASKSASEESPNDFEVWMPTWTTPTTIAEIRFLFQEGRIELRGQQPTSGVDFYRAIFELGIARGIDSFQRYGVLVRSGDAHYAVPIDRVRVGRNPEASLLNEIDGWYRLFRQKSTQEKPTPPSAMTRALRRIEDGIIRFCKQPEQTNAQQLLIAFGEGEKSLADSFRWTKENYLQPLFGLSPRWIELADDGTTEFRLAASLASVTSRFGTDWGSLRHHLEPIKTSKSSCWWGEESDRRVVWHDGELTDVLNRIFQRRLLIEQGLDPKLVTHFARIPAELRDIAEFIEGRVDERRIAKLLWAMSLVDFGQSVRLPRRSKKDGFLPPSFYALLKLCYPWRARGDESSEIPVIPMIHRRAADGQGLAASRLASQRLRASGFAPAVGEIAIDGDTARRAAAALIFPIRPDQDCELRKLVTRPYKDSKTEPDSIPELIPTETTS